SSPCQQCSEIATLDSRRRASSTSTPHSAYCSFACSNGASTCDAGDAMIVSLRMGGLAAPGGARGNARAGAVGSEPFRVDEDRVDERAAPGGILLRRHEFGDLEPGFPGAGDQGLGADDPGPEPPVVDAPEDG